MRDPDLLMASKILIIVVFIFDVIAFGLAVAAEQRRSIVRFYNFKLFFPIIVYVFFL